MRHINQAGIELIKSFEGLRLKAYKDSVGVPTIGYGHTQGVKMGTAISAADAERLLRADLADAEAGVEKLGIPLTPNQFAALVSFTFNLGAGNLRKLVGKGFVAIPARILLFDHAGGKKLAGLTRRRKAEVALFSAR